MTEPGSASARLQAFWTIAPGVAQLECGRINDGNAIEKLPVHGSRSKETAERVNGFVDLIQLDQADRPPESKLVLVAGFNRCRSV